MVRQRVSLAVDSVEGFFRAGIGEAAEDTRRREVAIPAKSERIAMKAASVPQQGICLMLGKEGR